MKKILCFIGILLFAAVAYGAGTDWAANIDWNTINDGTIVLALNPQSDFFGLNFYNPLNTEWKVFVPSQEELLGFARWYNFEIQTLTQNGKKVYVIVETNKSETPFLSGMSRFPFEIQLAALNLKLVQPSCFSLLDGHTGGSSGDACSPCGDDCCSAEEECYTDTKVPFCYDPREA